MKLLLSTIQPEDHFSQFQPTHIIGRLFNFPLIRVFVILIFFAPIMAFNSAVVYQVIENLQEPIASYVNMLRIVITIPLFILSYKYYCKIFERREAVEVSFDSALKQWGLGALVATLMVIVFVIMIAAVGEFQIIEYRSLELLLTNFLNFSVGSLMQDMVLLCIIYRLIEELAGSWISLIISLLLFAGVHGLNENESLVSIIMLMFSSLILIAPFILTRRLWLSWGFHAGWNFMQAGVFGMANSGIKFDGWIIAEINAPEWVSGGTVGLEATYHSAGIDFIIGVFILVMAAKAGKLVAPKWNANKSK